jgi:hypothetical protein
VGGKMNLKEVFALIFGVVGFIALRGIYMDIEMPSPNGIYDLKPVVFGFGILLIFIFGFFLGQENR